MIKDVAYLAVYYTWRLRARAHVRAIGVLQFVHTKWRSWRRRSLLLTCSWRQAPAQVIPSAVSRARAEKRSRIAKFPRLENIHVVALRSFYIYIMMFTPPAKIYKIWNSFLRLEKSSNFYKVLVEFGNFLKSLII